MDPDSTSVTDKRGWLWRLLTKLLHACWSYIEGGKRGKKKKKNFLEKSFYVVRSTKKMGLRYRESYKSFPWDQYMNTVCKYYVWDGLKHAHRPQRSKWIWNGICKCPGLFELFLTNSTFIGHLHMSILIFSPTFNICWKLTIFFCRETFPYDNFNWFMHIKCPKWHPL